MSVLDVDLPDGLRHRPLTREDAPADWLRPSHDMADTVGVLDGDRLVAYADLVSPTSACAAVLPDHQGRGIGTALARWVQQRARLAGSDRVGSQVPAGSAADRLMADLGYEVLWTAWDLELPPDRRLERRPLPPGHVVADAAPGDHPQVWALLEDAFLEWADRERQTFADFGARVWGRPDHEPWNLRVVRDSGGELVGATHVVVLGGGEVAHVARIAVRPDRRGRGLARAMLVDAFAVARGHGAVRATLATDSRAGARALYERAGMVVTSTWVNRSARL